MLSNFSGKSILFVFTTFLPFILIACFTSPVTPISTIAPTSTIHASGTQILMPTEEDIAARKQKIWDEVSRDIADFNQLVEQEKLLGNIETSHNSETGQEIFRFTGESDSKIRAAHKNLFDRINALYEEYLTLYKQDYNPTPFPMFSTKEESLKFYYQTLQEDQDWLETQEKAEDVLKIYDPDRGIYVSLLSFEQSSWLVLRNEALNKLRLEAELSSDLLANHKTIVEKLDGAPVEASEITSLPFYRSDLTLFQYQTENNFYVLNADGMIIQIIPIRMPLSDTLTPNAPLSTALLEEKALSLINLFAPGTDLQILTPAGGSKIGSFFFRWEDRTKPLLDDGRSYPFIQVALNSDGELLNYYNTLPLSR